MRSGNCRTWIVLAIGICLGCGKPTAEKPPATQEVPKVATAPATSETPTLIPTPAETPGDSSEIKKGPPAAPGITTTPTEKAAIPEAAYLSEDVVGMIVSHPRRIMELPVVQMLKKAGLTDELEQQSGLKTIAESIERATLIIDQASVDIFARAMGFEIRTVESGPQKKAIVPVKNNLKEIGLAFHNHEGVFQTLPRADGTGDGKKTGLSWRVHLLPFLDQQGLYDQFHFDEPWDSEHNKQLIAKMPDVFRSPESKADAGKTTYLGNAGETGLFTKPKKGQTKSPPPGIGMQQITDGTSNTAAMIEVSDERAVIWTKPDDFEPDPKDFLRGVVDAASQSFHLGLADGSVRTMSKKTPQDLLKAIFSRNGGEAISLP